MGREVLTRVRTEHRYQACRDEWCDRFPCRVYREGVEEGYQRGAAAAFAQGQAAGYAEGYADASASRDG